MPIRDHLSFFDIENFTHGLYTEIEALKQYTMPDGAAQQMDNCLALKTGGIRAFFKPTSLSASGIVTPANESVSGIGQRTGIPLRSGAAGDAVDRYMTTFNKTDFKTRLYRMDGTAGLTVWSQKDATWTLAAGTVNSCRSTQFGTFLDINGASWVCMVVRSAGGIGLYKIAYVGGVLPVASDGVITNLNSKSGPMAIAQARIMIGDGGAINPYRLYYGDPGLTTGGITTLANFLDIAPYQDGSALAIISPFEPSDLLIGREGAPWTLVMGDIASTTTPVREMGAVHTPAFTEQQICRTPSGIAFIEPGGRIHTTDGKAFTDISWQIDRFYKIDTTATDHVNVGQMAFAGQWLFCPQGYVRDWETGAWHRVTDMANASHWLYNAYNQKVWGSNGGASPTFWEYIPFDRQAFGGTGVERYNTYTWRSAPLADKNAREERIREVHLFLDASTAGSCTVTRTDSYGVQVARTLSYPLGKSILVFGFPNSGSRYQDITVTPASTNTAIEAPIIERIRVGHVAGRLIS